ncbi:MAG: hypothetical protein IKI31_03045 [Treponema sp.]|nr:hypothetical protein [Treponema sp.]
MFYQYVELADKTIIAHSEIKNTDGKKSIEVQFERPRSEGGFFSARCELPSYKWIFNENFSKEDLNFFEEFLSHNAHTLFKYAECGGIRIA